MAQRNARYNINLQLSYIRVGHQYHPITFPPFGPLPSSLNCDLLCEWVKHQIESQQFRIWFSSLPASFKFVPLSSVNYSCKPCHHKVHEKRRNQTKWLSFFIPQIKSRFVFQTIWYLAREIIVVKVSAIVQKKKALSSECFGTLSEIHYGNEKSSTNNSLRLMSVSIDGLIVPLN